MRTTSPTPLSIRSRNLGAVLLCLLASTAMVGDLAGSRILKGLGAVSAAAPFPKVFCLFEGVEGFACEFHLCYEVAGVEVATPLTPELYARLAGPYNRRNVYGAALAGGARLPRALWEPVFRHGFAEDGPLRREFGLPAGATNLNVLVRSRTRGRPGQGRLQPAPSS